MATSRRNGSSQLLARLKPQMGNDPIKFIENLAEKMVQALGKSEPPFQTDAFEYATLAGAKVLQIRMREYSGLMSVFDGRIVIEVNRDDSFERKNFTVCHEVGHIELRKAANLLKPSRARKGRFLDTERPNEGTTRAEERLVERFAASLLMPPKVFTEKAQSLPPSLLNARTLAKTFGASLGATIRRIVGLRAWPCIAIWGVPEKMRGENAWAVQVHEFKSAFEAGGLFPKQNYVWWAGEQFWRASQSDWIVADNVTINGTSWMFEGLREWHYTRCGERENRVMALLLPS